VEDPTPLFYKYSMPTHTLHEMNSSPSGVTRYRMLSAKDNNVTSGSAAVYNEDSPEPWGFATNLKKTVNRET